MTTSPNAYQRTLIGSLMAMVVASGGMPRAFFNAYMPKERRDVDTHPMITSSKAEIAAWNLEVTKRKMMRHKERIIRRAEARAAQ